MNVSESLTLGVVVGLMIGAIVCVALFRYANKDKKVKTEYDERQKQIRGRGYTIGFYTVVGLLGVEALLSMSGIGFPVPDYIVYFATIMTGILVVVFYSIWHGVYWGMNNDPKRYMIIMAIAVALNVIPVAGAIADGGLDTGELFGSLPMMNIIVLIVFAIILAEMLVKYILDRNRTEED